MARRKLPSPMGLSMLDLISNSLAAVIILFIILAALRIPSIPPERVKGTLMVRLELLNSEKEVDVRSEPWVNAPLDVGRPTTEDTLARLFGKGIQAIMNGDRKFYPDSICQPKSGTKPAAFCPCAMAYSDVDQPNVHYLVFRDPLKCKWYFGLIYVDHGDLLEAAQSDSIRIDYWLMTDNGNYSNDTTAAVVAPTEWKGWELDVEQLSNKLIMTQ